MKIFPIFVCQTNEKRMPGMRNQILIFLSLVILMSCGQNKTARFTPLSFPEVVPPGMMSDPQDRADWLAKNYWNGLTDP